ncbi:annexin XIV, partial [Metarhizium majus ARSEF 297]
MRELLVRKLARQLALTSVLKYPTEPPPQAGYSQYPPPQGQHPPPQGQYPPQQGHYPPQQGGYYQQPPPPPPGHYPPPHQQPYGQQPPPPPHFNAPPPAPSPYGHHSPAPPQGQYAAPYGAPPPQPYGHSVPATPPSKGYGAPQIIQWDANPDAQALRAAMKGFGTDEKALIRILSTKDPLQIDLIRTTFDRTFKRSLIDDIKSETSRYFEDGLVQLAYGPLLADVHNLRDAMKGIGTKESVLNDVLLGRSNADIKAIKGAYRQQFGRSLEQDVKGDLSMKTERHFLMVLAANRAEDAEPVDPRKVDDAVMHLYQATEGRMGTDEILVCQILTSHNDNQIRAIAHTYRQKFNRDLAKVIDSEFSGHMRDALLFQLGHAVDKYMHAAELLEETMRGAGTKDYLLVLRVVRLHWDHTMLSNVKAAYQQRYRRSLASRIDGEVSGDYKRLMLACIGEWR